MAARRYDIVQQELARLGSEHGQHPVVRCALALQAQAADALDQLWRTADPAARDEAFAHDFELALILIHLVPALGLLVARACLVDDEAMAEVLANLADEARAELGFPAGDRTRGVQAAARGDQARGAEPEAANAGAADLRAALDRSLDRNRELERRVLALETLLRHRLAARAAASGPAESAEVRALRARIEELQEMLRERTALLAQLRQQLEEAGDTAGAARPRPPSTRR